MDFDLVLKEIGEFGRYQKTNFLLICLPVIFAAANTMSYIFTSGVPNYRCLVPECDDLHNPNYDEPWVIHAVPSSTKGFSTFMPEQCERFESNRTMSWTGKECPAGAFSKRRLTCDRWVFDNYERTIVNDWSITCPENQWMLALVGTFHFAGVVVGSGAFGLLADRLGRKNVFLFCIIFMGITGIGQALSNSYVMFLLFAFLNALGTSGVYPLAFIIGVEMVGPSKREMCGIVLNYFYSIGEAVTGLAAWYSRDWVLFQYIVSAPSLIFILYYWLVPESVRWLLANNQTFRAGKIIRKAALTNGVALSDGILQVFEMVPMSINESTKQKESKTEVEEPEIQSTWTIVKSILKFGTFVWRFIFLIYLWSANAFVFYGLSLNSTNLSGNKFLNYILVCLVEIPALTLAWICMNKIGRRWSLAGSLFLCATTCIACAFVAADYIWLLILLFLAGKMGITASFAVIYVHTTEMLPTIIRSAGVGVLVTISRFGALVAPFVPLLSRYFEPMPMLIFGGVAFAAVLLALLLPETLGEKLPDTVEEALILGQKPSKCHQVEANVWSERM